MRKAKYLLLAAALMLSLAPARAAEPLKVGVSLSLTGGSAVNGKQLLAALEIWRDDVNAKGGLLGRPVQLDYYDDQSAQSNAPAIYTKLIDVDKVDLVIGPYGTNIIAATLPVIMQHNMATVGMMGLGANSQFHYKRYFSILPIGPDPATAFSTGFFDLLKGQNPKPQTIAIVGADAEFGKTTTDGGRANAKAAGLKIVYDKLYPPNTVDFAPIIRAIKAQNPDVVFVGAYPPDTVGLVRAASEEGFQPKMFGGAMIGMTATVFKGQLGPLMNGFVINEVFVPSPSFNFPGLDAVMKKYQAEAKSLGTDPLGYGFVPFGYAAGQVLAAAVEGTKSLDGAKIADYLHGHTVATVVGDVAFGPDGEWKEPRLVFTQFQGVTGNSIDQFRDTKKEVVVWPPQYATGKLIYPFAAARK
ncbi:MAG TPA: amino acid ABC transporter substrate-binding protein [Stellaceae bacterium]|nr:amino acid ABC transporter substrate-binding protein [Stellaceae bacterium]